MFRLWKMSTAVFVFQAVAFVAGFAEGSPMIGAFMAVALPSVLCIVLRDNEMFDLYDVCRSAIVAVAGATIVCLLWLLPAELEVFSFAWSPFVIAFCGYGTWYFARGAANACCTPIDQEDISIGSWIAMPFGIGSLAGVGFVLCHLSIMMMPPDDLR